MCIYRYMYIYIYIYSVNQGFHVSKGDHIRIYMKNCIYGYTISFYRLPCIQWFKFMDIWIYSVTSIASGTLYGLALALCARVAVLLHYYSHGGGKYSVP